MNAKDSNALGRGTRIISDFSGLAGRAGRRTLLRPGTGALRHLRGESTTVSLMIGGGAGFDRRAAGKRENVLREEPVLVGTISPFGEVAFDNGTAVV